MSGYDDNGSKPGGTLGDACTNSVEGFQLEPGYNGSYWFEDSWITREWDCEAQVVSLDKIIADANANWAQYTSFRQPFCFNTDSIASCSLCISEANTSCTCNDYGHY